MKSILKFSITTATFLALASNSVFASSSDNKRYDLMSHSENSVLSSDGVVIDGVNVKLSAWTYIDYSTDWERRNGSWTQLSSSNVKSFDESNAQFVGQPNLNYDYGYGVQNSHEATGAHQTIDNLFDYDSDDNWHTAQGNRTFDYILFSFDKAVSLNSVELGWHAGSGQQLSVAALSGANLENNSWTNIVQKDSLGKAISSSFNIAGDQYNGVANVSDAFRNEFSNLWLVGAYNKIFGNIGGSDSNDKFKLSALSFDVQNTPPPTQVSEPGALALMGLGLGLVLYRRKRRV
ncbi:exosortase-dependent surface protein XDP1 [Alteromonas macleodii]|jgi:hypothetical protein|uniref:exosortase-dependent surface protein XDP1 n=1 Tax=Alteromonas TaxID=226 RepID=UPI001000BC6B|nr:exosortase-dependent surface protein XDP1 [Alteromonas macleodii]RUM31024.1 MAG: hypothetical protein DSY75_04635 [Alteromonas sp.]|tara:strand:+ start:2670 stop:3542 length:873 start_codon:yes stop_codon:yes gene_type:complete